MAKLQLVKASTDVTVYVFIQDDTATDGSGLTGLVYNSAGLTCYYVRSLAAAAQLTLATQTVTGAHSDGGFVEVDATNLPGVYRLDLSDTIVATGVDSVLVMLKGATNMAPVLTEIQLTDFDLNDGVRGALTALPNAAADAAGGLPISDAGGLDLDAMSTNQTTILNRIGAFTTGGVNTILGFFQALMRSDATTPSDVGGSYDDATDSLQAIRDRGDAAWTTGAGGSDRLLMVDTTIATLASQTSFTLTAGSADDDAYVNCTIVIEDVSTATQKAIGVISAYTGSTKTVTLKYDPGVFTMATTDKVYILAENSLKSTDQNRQLDVTAGGAAGIDWSNVENPTTALDLSGTDIQLVDTTTANSDMRGTDSAALATVATEARLAELDAANMPADLDAVLVDTNELQTDWANGGRLDLILDARASQTTADAIETDTQDIQSRLPAALVSGRIDSDVGAMQAGVITATALATDAAQEIADEMLKRGVSNVEDAADTTSLAGIILAIFESSIAGTTWTIRKTGGATFVTKTVTVDAAADPITGVT